MEEYFIMINKKGINEENTCHKLIVKNKEMIMPGDNVIHYLANFRDLFLHKYYIFKSSKKIK